MSVERLPIIRASMTQLFNPVSEWAGKLVAPLSAPVLSQEGFLELADRVKLIVAMVLLAVIAVAIKYRFSQTSSPEPTKGRSNSQSATKPLGESATIPSIPQAGDNSIISRIPLPPVDSSVNSLSLAPTSSNTPPPAAAAGEVHAVPNSNINSTPSKGTMDLLTNSLNLGSGFNPSERLSVVTLKMTIEGDVGKVRNNFDQCLKDLQFYKPGSKEFQEKIVDFKRKTANFLKVYGPYEKDEQAFPSSFFTEVRDYETLIMGLNDILRGIIRVKGDGNCLFYSFVEAFRRLRVYLEQAQLWDERLLNHDELRQCVNHYMQVNFESDENLKNLLDQAITAHVQARKTDIPLQRESLVYRLFTAEQLKAEGFAIDTEASMSELHKLEDEENSLDAFEGRDKYKLYFSKFKEPGFFAAFAAAYAMCKILNGKIGIRVAVEPERHITAEYNAFNEDAPFLITLIFKGDHFDVQFPEGTPY